MAHSTQTSSLLKVTRNLIPLFLCPLHASYTGVSYGLGRQRLKHRSHQFHADATATASYGFPTSSQLLHLPRSCPGCGAFTQTVNPEQPGFYGTNRKSVKAFIGRNGQHRGNGYNGESEVFNRVLGAADANLLSQMGLKGGGENGQIL